jgi:hypothetical protein
VAEEEEEERRRRRRGGGGGGGVVGELDWGWRGGGEWEIGVPNQ